MDPDKLKLIPKVDEYELGWIRHNFNVERMARLQLESLMVVILDERQDDKKNLHMALVQRQSDMLKIAEMSMQIADLEKMVSGLADRLTDRIDKCDSRLDKASELLAANIKRDKAVAKKDS